MRNDPGNHALPAECLVCVPNGDKPIVGWARRGQLGLRVVGCLQFETGGEAAAYVNFINEAMGTSRKQAFCMLVGALMGWNHPKADPARLLMEERHATLAGGEDQGASSSAW